MADLKPETIIELFDRTLTRVFGTRYARENPHKSDKATAKEWIDAGCDVFIATVVFYDRMSRMHEKSLRFRPGTPEERALVPHSLKVFDDSIHVEIRVALHDGEMDAWERSQSQWRSRIMGWQKNPRFWQENMWGQPPGQPGCRAPLSLLKEMCPYLFESPLI